jgi:hypothetical protein
VPALDQRVDLRTQPHERRDRPRQREAQRVELVGVLRIGHQHVDGGIGLAHGAQMELPHELGRQRDGFRRQVGRVLGRHQRQVEHRSDRFGMVAFGHEAQPAQQREQRAARFGFEPARARKVGVLQAAAFEQQRDDARLDGITADGFLAGVDHRVHAHLR